MKRKRMILLLLLAVLLLLILPGFYNGLAIRRYSVEAPGIARLVRIALITDLHSCAYGTGQRELLDARSELARGDAERVPADQLTPGAFASAVRQFIGTCARMPHMRMAFAAMDYQEKRTYDELLSTVEQWAMDSRKALDVVMAEGSVV